jgi:hypothetical protein
MSEIISVKLVLDDNLKEQFAQAANGVKSGSDKIEKSFGGLKEQAAKLGAAIVAAFAVDRIIAFGKDCVTAYDQSVVAAVKLRTALGGTSAALLEQAVAFQKTTRFEDDEITAAQAILATYGLTEAQLLKITPAILDMAAATGDNISGAMDKVGRTIATSTNAMAREGIVIGDSTSKSARLAEVTAALEARFKGQAEAVAKLGAGPLVQLSNAFEDVKENIGKNIIEFPLFTAAISAANAVLGIAKRATEEASDEYQQMAEDINQKTLPPILDLNEALLNIVTVAPQAGMMLGAVPKFADPESIKKIAESFKFVSAEADATVVNITASVNRIRKAISKDAGGPKAKTGRSDLVAGAAEPLFISDQMNRAIQESVINAEKNRKAVLTNAAKEEEDAAQRKYDRIAEIQQGYFDDLAANYERQKQFAYAFGDAMAAGIGKGAEGWKISGKAMLVTMLDLLEKQVFLADVGGIIQTIFGNPAALGEIFALHAAFAIAKAGVNSFEHGGDFVTRGPQLIMVGDNPSGVERVSVTPMGGRSGGGAMQIHMGDINVTGNADATTVRAISETKERQLKRLRRMLEDLGYARQLPAFA